MDLVLHKMTTICLLLIYRLVLVDASFLAHITVSLSLIHGQRMLF